MFAYLFTEQSSIQTAMINRLIAYYRGMSVDDQDELLMLAEYIAFFLFCCFSVAFSPFLSYSKRKGVYYA